MIALLWIVLVILIINIPYMIFHKPPKPSCKQQYEYILILGCPANDDGTLSSAQLRRIQAAATYVKKGYANHIIISGGAVKNQFVEAQIMGDHLQEMLVGFPLTLSLETNARNTFQNMQQTKAQYGGTKVLVVTGSSHIRRAYFFAKKFYTDCSVGFGKLHDPCSYTFWEYTRMWVALYWEIKLSYSSKHKV